MQFQVPQFIETEDKIVGPFTLKQFMYIGGAAGISFFLYFTLPTFWWAVASLPFLAAGIAFAFVKVNGQPFGKIILAALAFLWKPQTYVWQPEQPNLPKTKETIRSSVSASGFSLESILAGLALKNARERVETGAPGSRDRSARLFGRLKEQYEVITRIGGEHRVARRVDYR